MSNINKKKKSKIKLYAEVIFIAVLLLCAAGLAVILKNGENPAEPAELIPAYILHEKRTERTFREIIQIINNPLQSAGNDEDGEAVAAWKETETETKTEYVPETPEESAVSGEPKKPAAEKNVIKKPAHKSEDLKSGIIKKPPYIPEPETEPETEAMTEPAAEPVTGLATEPVPAYDPDIQFSNVITPLPAAADDEKRVALTFDDGPSPYTWRLLEILIENDAKATFFVVGYKTPNQEYARIIKAVAAQGSLVAGHSWNHPNLTKLSGERVRNELQSADNAIFNLTGIRPRMYRPPYGSYNQNVKNISKELGLSIIYWSVDPSDWKYRNADTVYNRIMSKVKGGSIIGCHDTYKSTVDAMERVIPDLIAAGYRLVTVEELLETLEPGEVYTGRR